MAKNEKFRGTGELEQAIWVENRSTMKLPPQKHGLFTVGVVLVYKTKLVDLLWNSSSDACSVVSSFPDFVSYGAYKSVHVE